MNKQKIDQRLKEIEEEVILLSGYLSESVENKLGVHLNNLKESMNYLKKTINYFDRLYLVFDASLMTVSWKQLKPSVVV